MLEKKNTKKHFFLNFISLFGSPIMVSIAFIWIFSYTRANDWIKYEEAIFYAVVGVLIGCFSVPLLGFILLKKGFRTKKVYKIFLAFSIITFTMPTGVMLYYGPIQLFSAGDKAPQLLVVNRAGSNGIPDMAVVYWNESPTKDSLSFRNETSGIWEHFNETIPKNSHVFVLSNLSPDTQYFYRINNENPTYNFTTMSGNNDTFRFGFSSDAHFGRDISNNTASIEILKQISDPINNYSMFVSGGDLLQDGFNDFHWKTALDSISPYTIPFRPIMGNHECFLGGENNYLKYLYPEEMPTSSGSRFFYRLDINNIHLFLLDIEWGMDLYESENQLTESGQTQKEWFEAELSSVPDEDWTIVVTHCNFYSSSGDQWEMINTFNKTFVDNDVDIVLSGHDHQMEILNESTSGIVYNIVGAFGGAQGSADPPSDYSSWYKIQQHGFLEVNIRGNFTDLIYRTPEN
ncbi:MAG: hypothetical protein GY870_20380, partial [archaeon]|nr:hypothetical protein [archaeon]